MSDVFKQFVMDVLAGAGDWSMVVADITGRTGLRRRVVTTALGSLVSQGKVRVREGRYIAIRGVA